MSDTSPYGFELVRRGYDRAQVDERISKLVSDRDSALARITALEKRIEELHLETQNAQAAVTDAEPSYAGLGARREDPPPRRGGGEGPARGGPPRF